MLGIPYTITNDKFICCSLTQGIYNFLRIIKEYDEVDEIFHYGHPASILPDGITNISVIDDDDLMESYGYYSQTEEIKNTLKYDVNDTAHTKFNEKTSFLLRKNLQENDIVLFSAGKSHENIYNSLKPIESEVACIEYMVNYNFSIVDYFHVYPTYGHRLSVERAMGTYDSNIKFSDRVITWGPNPEDFEYSKEKEDYLLFLGEIKKEKGIDLCIQLANIHGFNLKVAGCGNLPDLEYDLEKLPENVELIGLVDRNERKDLLKNAKALLSPSELYEPLGWSAVEAMLSGTPVISSDFGGFTETVIQGVTGYRCNTYKEFSDAIENIDKLDNESCYNITFDKFKDETVRNKYVDYFKFVFDVLNGSGFYEGL